LETVPRRRIQKHWTPPHDRHADQGPCHRR
jgi:hypothetical protein